MKNILCDKKINKQEINKLEMNRKYVFEFYVCLYNMKVLKYWL